MTTLTAATPSPSVLGPAVSSRPPTMAPSGLSGGDILRIVRQRLVLILILWVVLSGAASGVTIYIWKYFPSYTSPAYIRVQSMSPVNVLNPLEKNKVEEQEVQRLLIDQALIVKSPQVLENALGDNELRGTSWFREAQRKDKEKNEDPKDLLADIVNAAPIRDSNYVAVSVTWRVASEVPILVNAIVQKYMDLINEQQKISIRKTEDSLQKELQTTKTLYDTKQEELENFRRDNGIIGRPEEQTNEQLLTLRALVTELEVDMIGKQSMWESLENVKPEELPITPELAQMLENDPTIYQLNQRLQGIEETLITLEDRYGPNHRTVKEAKSQRDMAAARVAEERSAKLLRYQAEQKEQARRNYYEANDQLMRIRERLQDAEAEQKDKNAKYWRYVKMKEEGEQLKGQYETLLEQRNMLGMVIRQDKQVQIDVRSWAIEPRRRSNPKLEIWLPAGVVLSLALSVGFAILLELTDKSVRTPRDVLRQSLSVLGTIPVTDDDEVEIERVETATLDAPHSIVAEAFRNLRANLFFAAPPGQQSTLLVTSPSGGNGKTTIATNIAIAIAISGRRVLLIDANFRRPGLPRIFDGMKAEGLSNVLIGQSRLDDVVVTTQVPGLDVMSAGPTPPNPAELLGSTFLRELVGDARARYDQIIFDGPPVLLVSDALVLSGAVDGVLLVCQYRTTSRGALQRTQSRLDACGSRIFGAVLNRVETRAGGYFRKTYREFYEYHEPEEAGDSDRPRLGAGKSAASEVGGGRSAEVEADADVAGAALAGERELGVETPVAEIADDAEIKDAGSTGIVWGGEDIDAEIEKLKSDDLLADTDDLKIIDDSGLKDDDLAGPSKPTH